MPQCKRPQVDLHDGAIGMTTIPLQPSLDLSGEPRPAAPPGAWREMSAAEAEVWNERLQSSTANYKQYPAWHEPYRAEARAVHYFVYESAENALGYVALVIRGRSPVRIAIIQRGPVWLDENATFGRSEAAGLVSQLRRLGCAAVRVTHESERVLAAFRSLARATSADAFPFERDPPRSLLVRLLASDEETLAQFQQIARRNIRAAERAGYEITTSNSPQDVAAAWPLFKALAERKGFELSRRSLNGWLDYVRRCADAGAIQLYSAYREGACVQAILVVKYGQQAEFLLGALDFDAVRDVASPSCLIHWLAMRDARRAGCAWYNLGGPGNGVTNLVYQFKQKFRPTLQEIPAPVTVPIAPVQYRLWSLLMLQGWLPMKRQLNRIRPFRSLPRRIWNKLPRLSRVERSEKS